MMNLPNTQLKDLAENTVKLADLVKKDKLNLILFYNTGCLGCTGRAIPLAYNLKKENDFLELIVIHSNFGRLTLANDEILSIFYNKKNPFNIYSEEQHELYDYFGAEGTPHWIVMDGEGNIVNSIFGSQERSQIRLGYAIEEYKESMMK